MEQRLLDFLENGLKLIKGILMGIVPIICSIIFPIKHYLIIVAAFAFVSTIVGFIADHYKFRLKKAVKSWIYFTGYVFLLLLVALTGLIMQEDSVNVNAVIYWLTWVIIYYYSCSILRNWHIIQPDNQVISLLYWVITFKITEKIKFLKDFTDQNTDNNGKC